MQPIVWQVGAYALLFVMVFASIRYARRNASVFEGVPAPREYYNRNIGLQIPFSGGWMRVAPALAQTTQRFANAQDVFFLPSADPQQPLALLLVWRAELKQTLPETLDDATLVALAREVAKHTGSALQRNGETFFTTGFVVTELGGKEGLRIQGKTSRGAVIDTYAGFRESRVYILLFRVEAAQADNLQEQMDDLARGTVF
jgi:hypothetical protein